MDVHEKRDVYLCRSHSERIQTLFFSHSMLQPYAKMLTDAPLHAPNQKTHLQVY